MRRTTTVVIHGHSLEMDALELERTITALGDARAQVDPPVPEDKPLLGLDTHVSSHPNPSFSIANLPDGGVRIYLRNPGLGWLSFDLPPTTRKQLAEFLAKPLGHSLTQH